MDSDMGWMLHTQGSQDTAPMDSILRDHNFSTLLRLCRQHTVIPSPIPRTCKFRIVPEAFPPRIAAFCLRKWLDNPILDAGSWVVERMWWLTLRMREHSARHSYRMDPDERPRGVVHRMTYDSAHMASLFVFRCENLLSARKICRNDQTSAAAACEVPTVVSPYENPTPTGWSMYRTLASLFQENGLGATERLSFVIRHGPCSWKRPIMLEAPG